MEADVEAAIRQLEREGRAATLSNDIATWDRLLADTWTIYPGLPFTALAVAALLGLATWCVRAPRSGIAASLLVLLPLAASAAGVWPLPARTNLAMVAVLHLGFIYLAATLIDVLPPRWTGPLTTAAVVLATLAIPAATLLVIREAAPRRSGSRSGHSVVATAGGPFHRE